jgi:hypothetical protein
MNKKPFHSLPIIRQLLGGLIAAAMGASHAAYAHVVWIEPKGEFLVVRFAEPGSDFEVSPGYLDNLLSPIAFAAVKNGPASIEATKKSDHFLLVGASPANSACVETSFTVRGGRKPIFYARWQPANAGAATPLLTLDLVPTGKEGEVRAYFRGKPLGGIAATLRTPDEKEQELTANAEGILHFEPKQAGQYLLTIAHYREALAGFHAGQPYKETSHNCSLTWRQP